MTSPAPTPIFIFSLPRAGSTMLQRILAGHSEISSSSEPWLLLPLVHMLKDEGTVSVYSHQTCRIAMNDLITNMQGGADRYRQLLRQFVESVYASSQDEPCRYFLDKTPRYYMIIPEILEIFPDAKFIFLFRNPIHVYASIISTWGNGSFKLLFRNRIDVEKGPKLLSRGYQLLKDRAYALQYEALVSDPEPHLKDLLAYLGLEYEESMLTKFPETRFAGHMGDPTGSASHDKVHMASLEKWKHVFSNRFRKKVLKKYVSGLPDDDLATQGYQKSDLIAEIDAHKVTRLTPVKDYYDYLVSVLGTSIQMDLFASENSKSYLGPFVS